MHKNTSTRTAIEAEHFIPVSKFALLEHFQKLGERSDNKKNYYAHFFQYLIACRHQKYRKRLNWLKKCYLPFSPDRDTLRVLEYSDRQLVQLQKTLVNETLSLVIRANYQQITQDDLNKIFSARSPYGLQLKVDLSEFEEMLLFFRGSSTETRQYRTFSTLFLKKESYEVPVFQRLFLLLKLKPKKQRLQEIMAEQSVDKKKAGRLLKRYRSALPEQINDNHIHLKLFKNIPQSDLKMLFPNTQVRLKPFDKIKLAVTAGGGSVGSVFATVTKIAAAANPIAAAGALAGLAGVIFRQVMKFFNQHTKYMMLLSQKLYFHSLANNRGVLTLLVDRAEEEEIKESILLYNFLSRSTINRKQLPRLKQHIEAYFFKQFGVKIDFCIKAPLASLKKDGILREDENGNLAVLNAKIACKHLEQKWQSYLAHNDNSLNQDDDNEL